VTAVPYVVSWNTTRSAGGRHTLSAVATDLDGTAGSSVPESVVVNNPAPPMTCFVLQAHVSAEGEGTVATPRFHTAAAGETLVAFVSSQGPVTDGQSATVTGAGLSWRLVKRASSAAGAVEIWAANAPHVLVGAAVRARAAAPRSAQQLTVIALEGVDGVGASSSGSGASGSPSVDLRTTKSTSLVFALADAGSGAGRALPRGWVHLDDWTGGSGRTGSWTQFSNQPTGAAGTAVKVTGGEPTMSPWDMVAVELVNDGG
jgi:hypothetical protein